MKIRTYTAEETNELISKFEVIAKYVYEINKCAYDIMNDKYKIYLEKFKFSIFQWKPLSFNDFTRKMSIFEPVFYEYELSEDSNLFHTNLFPHNFKWLSSGYEFYDDFMISKGVTGLSKTEQNTLLNASIISRSFLNNYNLHTKYLILLKYAHRPFEFDESDVSWVENVDTNYKGANVWISNLMKNNQMNY